MHRLTGQRSEPLIMRDRQPDVFWSFFRPIFQKVRKVLRTCHLCGRHSAGAQQTQKNRYQEVNSRWCNVTGAQIRAAEFASDGSVLNDSIILNESLMWLEKNESSRGVIRSVAHAHHPKGSVLELVHLFRVFGFCESFVHHVTAP